MRPRPYVEIQAFMSLLAVAVVILLGPAAGLTAAVFLTVGVAVWAYYLVRYRTLLLRRAVERSGDRRSKDRIMFRCFLVGLVLPAAFAWVDFVTIRLDPFGGPLHPGEAAIASIGVLAISLGILVSSSVDWYLIRPFREGVFNQPTCRPEIHDNGRGLDYARYWVLHRMVSEFIVFAGVVVLAGLFFAVVSTRVDSEEGKSAAGFISAVGIGAWSLTEISKLRAALRFVRFPFPACELGSWVSGRTASCVDVTGFVLDVSVSPGVQLIPEPRGHPATDIADEKSSVPLRQVPQIEPAEAPYRLCAERCEFWNPNCEVGLREFEEAS